MHNSCLDDRSVCSSRAFGSEDICIREAFSRGQKNDLYTAVENVHVMTKDGKTDAHVAVQECTFMQSYIHVCTCG